MIGIYYIKTNPIPKFRAQVLGIKKPFSFLKGSGKKCIVFNYFASGAAASAFLAQQDFPSA
jgi:hypothetical protein